MLALLVGAAVFGLVLVLGLVLAVVYALQPDRSPTAVGRGSATSGTPSGGDGRTGGTAVDLRDTLAAKPMTQVDDSASHPGAVSTHDPGAPIALPAMTGVGPAGVPTGFPHTRVRGYGSTRRDRSGRHAVGLDRYRPLCRPGLGVARRADTEHVEHAAGPRTPALLGVERRHVATRGRAHPIDGTDQRQRRARLRYPVRRLRDGRDSGPDRSWRRRGDCQRMVWQPASSRSGGRWLIGAGTEPAEAPAVWPGTDLSFAVGYSYLHPEASR